MTVCTLGSDRFVFDHLLSVHLYGGMALGAWHIYVFSGESEIRLRVMIENEFVPVDSGMASRAVGDSFKLELSLVFVRVTG